jgi:hypothetical protein
MSVRTHSGIYISRNQTESFKTNVQVIRPGGIFIENKFL